MVPATLEILRSDRDDRQALAGLLHAAIPASWPPPLLDDDELAEFIRIMAGGADPLFASG
ncbi:MAG: hypothetical protein JXA08_10315 [Methanomicrobiaceae archaeon]|nr:hypothetical protein [Methanomicrobiaceae archaeon]